MKRVLSIGFGIAATGCATAPSPSMYGYSLEGHSAEQAARDERAYAACMEPRGCHAR